MKQLDRFGFTLDSKPEKMIAAASVSTALAILFTSDKSKKGRGGKRKKKGFVSRVMRNYSVIDRLLAMSIAKKVAENERQKALDKEFKTKLRHLEIEEAIPFDPFEGDEKQ